MTHMVLVSAGCNTSAPSQECLGGSTDLHVCRYRPASELTGSYTLVPGEASHSNSERSGCSTVTRKRVASASLNAMATLRSALLGGLACGAAQN